MKKRPADGCNIYRRIVNMPQGNMSNFQFKSMKKCVIDESSGYRRDLRVFLLTMKLLIALIFAGALSVSASVYSQITKIDLQLNNSTVGEILKSIEKNSEFIFVYENNLVNTTIEKSISLRDAKIETILDQLFGSSEIAYYIDDRQIFLFKKDDNQQLEALKSEVIAGQSQKKEITGTVTDNDGKPIPGASVIAKGTTVATITNGEGEFRLLVPENATTLTISFIGMKSQEIDISKKTKVKAILMEETVSVDEIVVVGYGTQKKATVVG